MLASLLLSLREGLEAALIIGILFGALRKIQRPALRSTVWAGTLSAALLSLLAAVGLNAVGASFTGTGEQIFEGVTMLLAASVLTWMIFWMARQSRSLKHELEADVRRAAAQAGRLPLFSLAFLAVIREGIELALFLTAATLAADARQTLTGALLGLGLAIVLGWGLFRATIHLNLQKFFQITGMLLLVFAAGLVAHGVHEFNELGWIPALIEHVWDINPFLNEKSILGEILKALFGYNGNPSLTEVIAYLGYFGAIALGLRWQKASLPAVGPA
ncbi:MAG: FTR1 family protein [Anaerolineales bacterium]